jgi:phosphatidylglycerophosphate synthase
MAMTLLPNALTALRLALAPLLAWLAWSGAANLFLYVLAFALATDMVDGAIARRLGQASEFGTRLDSWADAALYTTVPFCLWWVRPDFLRAEALSVVATVASNVVPGAIGFLKFGRLPSYHTRGAKLSAILVGAGGVWALAGGSALPLHLGAMVMVATGVEEIAITMVLPNWHANIPSFAHARDLARDAAPLQHQP